MEIEPSLGYKGHWTGGRLERIRKLEKGIAYEFSSYHGDSFATSNLHLHVGESIKHTKLKIVSRPVFARYPLNMIASSPEQLIL